MSVLFEKISTNEGEINSRLNKAKNIIGALNQLIRNQIIKKNLIQSVLSYKAKNGRKGTGRGTSDVNHHPVYVYSQN